MPPAATLDALDAWHLSRYATPDGAVLPLGPGVVVYGGPNLPVNRATGLGLNATDARHLPTLEGFLADRGCRAQVEVNGAAHPEFLQALVERGYRLTRVLHSYGRDLEAPPPPPALMTRESGGPEWLHVVTAGFGLASRPVLALTARRPDTTYWVCELNGEVIAGGALSLHGEFAQLFSNATHPAARGQGAQSALLAARLRHAATQGACHAIVSVTPGSGSERNVRRAGFQLLAARLNFERFTQ